MVEVLSKPSSVLRCQETMAVLGERIEVHAGRGSGNIWNV